MKQTGREITNAKEWLTASGKWTRTIVFVKGSRSVIYDYRIAIEIQSRRKCWNWCCIFGVQDQAWPRGLPAILSIDPSLAGKWLTSQRDCGRENSWDKSRPDTCNADRSCIRPVGPVSAGRISLSRDTTSPCSSARKRGWLWRSIVKRRRTWRDPSD